MNVKKYRATTTREALEQVKMDLGEDAFVLETRQISTGGFLGIRTRKQIEISAAPANFADSPEDFFKSASAKRAAGIALVDDSYAAPKQSAPTNIDAREKIMNALAARAASSKYKETIFPGVVKAPKQTTTAAQKPVEFVEISSREPQVVHPKRIQTKVLPKVDNRQPVVRPEISRDDLEEIRTELREVKSSMNAAFSKSKPVPSIDFDFEREGAVFDYPFYDSYLEISKTGFEPAKIRKYLLDFVPQISKSTLPSADLSGLALKHILGSLLNYIGDPLETTRCLALIGATGVGKTTTIAKLAARAKLDDGKKVELVTLDTYRIAAVEQLKTYAEIIGAGCHVANTVEDLDRILNRIGDDATVLIDTTGRSPYDLSDQTDVSEYLRANTAIHKCHAIQATLNHNDGPATLQKFRSYGTDSLILTKMDEASRPGSILEVVAQSSLPLSYICMGQRVPNDIKAASVETIAEQIMPAEEPSLKMSA